MEHSWSLLLWGITKTYLSRNTGVLKNFPLCLKMNDFLLGLLWRASTWIVATSKAPHISAPEARGWLGPSPVASAQDSAASALNSPLEHLGKGSVLMCYADGHRCLPLHRCIHWLAFWSRCVCPKHITLFTLLRISFGKQRNERGKQHSAKVLYPQFQFVINIYDQVTTSPEKRSI